MLSEGEKDPTISPSYDKNPDDQMRAFGWKLNSRGEWSMRVDLYISQRERERVLKIIEQDKASEILDTLDKTLKECLQIDREIRHGTD